MWAESGSPLLFRSFFSLPRVHRLTVAPSTSPLPLVPSSGRIVGAADTCRARGHRWTKEEQGEKEESEAQKEQTKRLKPRPRKRNRNRAENQGGGEAGVVEDPVQPRTDERKERTETRREVDAEERRSRGAEEPRSGGAEERRSGASGTVGVGEHAGVKRVQLRFVRASASGPFVPSIIDFVSHGFTVKTIGSSFPPFLPIPDRESRIQRENERARNCFTDGDSPRAITRTVNPLRGHAAKQR